MEVIEQIVLGQIELNSEKMKTFWTARHFRISTTKEQNATAETSLK